MNVAQVALNSVFNDTTSDGTAEVERDRFMLSLLAAISEDDYTGKRPLTDALTAMEAYDHSSRPVAEMRARYSGILNHEAKK